MNEVEKAAMSSCSVDVISTEDNARAMRYLLTTEWLRISNSLTRERRSGFLIRELRSRLLKARKTTLLKLWLLVVKVTKPRSGIRAT